MSAQARREFDNHHPLLPARRCAAQEVWSDIIHKEQMLLSEDAILAKLPLHDLTVVIQNGCADWNNLDIPTHA